MHLTIAGGTGFIGHYLTTFFLDRGEHVTVIGRRPVKSKFPEDQFSMIQADTTMEGDWQKTVESSDVVINLTGQTILNPWTKAYKKKIEESRILTTQNIVNALSAEKTRLLFNASAIGYYGNRGEESLTETARPGEDFLARVGVKWESAALKATDKNIRVVLGRFGIILGTDGGALKKMIPAFKMFMGGPLGDGSQWFPWMHIHDLANAILFAIENKGINGPLNFTAPESTTNKTFVTSLGERLSRPTITPAPKFMVRLFLGEFGDTLLYSQKVIPRKLLDEGFLFQFPDIDSALKNIIGSN